MASSAKVNINKADAETLQKLSGIGEKKAQAIIDYRNKVGKIKSAAELSNIDGIGEATIEKNYSILKFLRKTRIKQTALYVRFFLLK